VTGDDDPCAEHVPVLDGVVDGPTGRARQAPGYALASTDGRVDGLR
jgi:hypothetical protein